MLPVKDFANAVSGDVMNQTLQKISHSTRRSLTRSSIGGERITDLLVGFLADEFNRKYKADPRETKRGKLL